MLRETEKDREGGRQTGTESEEGTSNKEETNFRKLKDARTLLKYT